MKATTDRVVETSPDGNEHNATHAVPGEVLAKATSSSAIQRPIDLHIDRDCSPIVWVEQLLNEATSREDHICTSSGARTGNTEIALPQLIDLGCRTDVGRQPDTFAPEE